MGSQLHRAATSGARLAVQDLLAAGIAVDALDEHNWTPLHLAAMAGHVEVVAALLGSGAQVNAKGQRGWTPLHVAALQHHTEVVALLVSAGAKADAAGEDNWTPLQEPMPRMTGPQRHCILARRDIPALSRFCLRLARQCPLRTRPERLHCTTHRRASRIQPKSSFGQEQMSTPLTSMDRRPCSAPRHADRQNLFAFFCEPALIRLPRIDSGTRPVHGQSAER